MNNQEINQIIAGSIGEDGYQQDRYPLERCPNGHVYEGGNICETCGATIVTHGDPLDFCASFDLIDSALEKQTNLSHLEWSVKLNRDINDYTGLYGADLWWSGGLVTNWSGTFFAKTSGEALARAYASVLLEEKTKETDEGFGSTDKDASNE